MQTTQERIEFNDRFLALLKSRYWAVGDAWINQACTTLVAVVLVEAQAGSIAYDLRLSGLTVEIQEPNRFCGSYVVTATK